MGVPYKLNFAKLKSTYKKGIKSADVLGVMTMTMTMTTLQLNINTGYKLEYTYNMIY